MQKLFNPIKQLLQIPNKYLQKLFNPIKQLLQIPKEYLQKLFNRPCVVLNYM
jgi:hypothetical protein